MASCPLSIRSQGALFLLSSMRNASRACMWGVLWAGFLNHWRGRAQCHLSLWHSILLLGIDGSLC